MNSHAGPSSPAGRKLANSSILANTFQTRVSEILPVYRALRPVYHCSLHSSQGSLLPECQSPLPASPCPVSHTPIKLSQSAGLETGVDRKKSEGSREFMGDGASSKAALLFSVKVVWRLVGWARKGHQWLSSCGWETQPCEVASASICLGSPEVPRSWCPSSGSWMEFWLEMICMPEEEIFP